MEITEKIVDLVWFIIIIINLWLIQNELKEIKQKLEDDRI